MDATTFVADLRHRGIRLRLEGDRLVAVPGSALTSEDAGWIQAHKPAIVALLAAQDAPRPIVPLRPDCVTCGASLAEGSMLRCPSCVQGTYEERNQRRRAEGRAPP